MGLDSVILIQDVEEYFGIEIPNDEAEQIFTVADFANSVYKHITPSVAQKCKTQAVFYKVHSFFSEELQIDRGQVSPNTPLNNLLAVKERTVFWAKLENYLQLKLPKLSSGDIAENKGYLYKFFGLNRIKSEEIIFSNTVGNLVEMIVALNYNSLFEVDKLGNLFEVQQVLIGMISDKLSIPIEEVKLESNIVNDFGLD